MALSFYSVPRFLQSLFVLATLGCVQRIWIHWWDVLIQLEGTWPTLSSLCLLPLTQFFRLLSANFRCFSHNICHLGCHTTVSHPKGSSGSLMEGLTRYEKHGRLYKICTYMCRRKSTCDRVTVLWLSNMLFLENEEILSLLEDDAKLSHTAAIWYSSWDKSCRNGATYHICMDYVACLACVCLCVCVSAN